MYSRHGHFIPGTVNRGGPNPVNPKNCGAFESCSSCKHELQLCREESMRLGAEWSIRGGAIPPVKTKLDEYFDNFVELLDEVVDKPRLKELLLKEVEFLRNAAKEEDK